MKRTYQPSKTRRQRRHGFLVRMRTRGGRAVINARLFAELKKTLGTLAVNEVGLESYMRHLAYLGRAPGWGTQALRMHFYEGMEKLAQIEPMALLFIQDQLRGSPLLLETLPADVRNRVPNFVSAERISGQTDGLHELTLPTCVGVKRRTQPGLPVQGLQAVACRRNRLKRSHHSRRRAAARAWAAWHPGSRSWRPDQLAWRGGRVAWRQALASHLAAWRQALASHPAGLPWV